MNFLPLEDLKDLCRGGAAGWGRGSPAQFSGVLELLLSKTGFWKNWVIFSFQNRNIPVGFEISVHCNDAKVVLFFSVWLVGCFCWLFGLVFWAKVT